MNHYISPLFFLVFILLVIALLLQVYIYASLFKRPCMRLVNKRFRNVNIHKMGPDWLEWRVPKELQKYE